MSTRIKLHFVEAVLQELSKEEEYELTRLMGWVVFRTTNHWSEPMDAIIDTGAHTSILPKTIWKGITTEIQDSYDIQGISTRPECKIPCKVGTVTARFIDETNNTSDEIKMRAFLALTDEVPLIIGFKDVLSRFKVCFDHKRNNAYLEELKI